MAGRGRGRGRGATMSFSIESLGFGRGEALPTAIVEPRQIYPTLEYKPVPLEETDEQKYLLALKQEFRSAMRDSPYFIKTCEKRKEVERYSDKYQQNSNDGTGWKIDWNRFPAELKIKPKKRLKARSTIKPRVNNARQVVTSQDIEQQLQSMETKEGDEGSEDEKEDKDKKEEGEEVEEEEVEEEELEDDTDYNVTYFDNGENYGAEEEDDVDEGATY